ncbi:hypothetical protein ACHHYP_00738 [Achlya hypogyna]|uniref:C2 domain-containing protein n=1 Tax=Achlya hypogyna TaxID=1202772 RepID=A0A1V9ZU03_ACHHY|nr:hypothetical protein ACHHYP_00738 [Achlya hypogyna]
MEAKVDEAHGEVIPGDDDAEMKAQDAIISLGALPPHVEGTVMGYVRVRVRIRVDGNSPRVWLVRVRWWGALTMHQKGDVLREGQTLSFPVHVSRDGFQRYVNDMGPLRLDIVDKQSHQVFGRAEVSLTMADMEVPNGIAKEAPIVHKGTMDVRGTVQLTATLLWGDLSTAAPMGIASTVVLRKNRDFMLPISFVAPPTSSRIQMPSTGDSGSDLYSKNKYHDPSPKTPISAHRLDTLLKKGEALKRAMQRAVDNAPDTTASSRDVATVIATAKSLGPNDLPSLSWRNFLDQYTEDDLASVRTSVPSLLPPEPIPVVRPVQLECFLVVPYVDKILTAERLRSLHLSTKIPWCSVATITSKPMLLTSRAPSSVHFGFRARGPLGAEADRVGFFTSKTLVIEMWQWVDGAPRESLFGLVKLPLHPIAEYLETVSSGELGVAYDDVARVVNPFDGVHSWSDDVLEMIDEIDVMEDWSSPNLVLQPMNTDMLAPVAAFTVTKEAADAATDVVATSAVKPNIATTEFPPTLDDDANEAISLLNTASTRQLSPEVPFPSIPIVPPSAALTPEVAPAESRVSTPAPQPTSVPTHREALCHHWTLSLLEPFGGAKASGVGCEIRYSFEDSPCTMWWDGSNPAWSSVNELVSTEPVVALALELWWKPTMASVLRCIGRASLELDAEAILEPVAIHWDLPHFQVQIPFLPLRVTHAQKPQAHRAESVVDSKATSSTLLPAASTICVAVSSLQLASAAIDAVQVQCAFCIGDIVHPEATSVAFDQVVDKWMMRQLSPLLAPNGSFTFAEQVMMHPALLKSMAVDDVELTAWHISKNQEPALLGLAAIPLAALLFRTQGIRGVFPLLRESVYHGRVSVHIYFEHHRGSLSFQVEQPPTVEHKSSKRVDPPTILVPVSSAVEGSDCRNEAEHASKLPPGPTTPLVRGDSRFDVQISILETRHLVLPTIHVEGSVSASFEWEGARHSTAPVPASPSAVFDYVYHGDAAAPFDRRSSLTVAMWLHEKTKVAPPELLGQATVDLSLLQWMMEVNGWYHLVDSAQHPKGQVRLRVQRSGVDYPPPEVASVSSAPVEAAVEPDSWSVLDLMRQELATVDHRLTETFAASENPLDTLPAGALAVLDCQGEPPNTKEFAETEGQTESYSGEPTGFDSEADQPTSTPCDAAETAVIWNDSDEELDMAALNIHAESPSEDGASDDRRALNDDEEVNVGTRDSAAFLDPTDLFAIPASEDESALEDVPQPSYPVDVAAAHNRDVVESHNPPTSNWESDDDSCCEVDLSALSVFAPPSEAYEDAMEDSAPCDLGAMGQAALSELDSPAASLTDDYEELATLLAPVGSPPASLAGDFELAESVCQSEHSHGGYDDVLKTVLETMQDIKTQMAQLSVTPCCSVCASPVRQSPAAICTAICSDTTTQEVPLQSASPIANCSVSMVAAPPSPSPLTPPATCPPTTQAVEVESTTPAKATPLVPCNASVEPMAAAAHEPPVVSALASVANAPTSPVHASVAAPAFVPEALGSHETVATIAEQLARLVQRLDEPLPSAATSPTQQPVPEATWRLAQAGGTSGGDPGDLALVQAAATEPVTTDDGLGN